MRAYYQRRFEMLNRVSQYVLDHPITPPIPRATALFAEVNILAPAVLAHGGDQVFGQGGYRAGATERRVLAADLKEFLKDMSATARGLEPEHPGITDQFRLGRATSSFARLVATGHAFLTAVTPPAIKDLFVSRAFAADFDVELTTKIAALAAATGRKASGLQTQKGGSAGLDILNRRITATMRELNALMRKYLRERNQVQFEVWKAAARTYRQPVGTTTAPFVDSGSGSTQAGNES